MLEIYVMSELSNHCIYRIFSVLYIIQLNIRKYVCVFFINEYDHAFSNMWIMLSSSNTECVIYITALWAPITWNSLFQHINFPGQILLHTNTYIPIRSCTTLLNVCACQQTTHMTNNIPIVHSGNVYKLILSIFVT